MTLAHQGLVVAILAAGEGRRFDGIKQLAPVLGKPLLQHSVDVCRQIPGARTLVVLGAHRTRIRAQLDFAGVAVCINAAWREGMAASIRVAVGAAGPQCRGLLLLAADQVRVSGDDLARLIAAWRAAPEAIVAAHYMGSPGIPAIFPATCFADLLALTGDKGAKPLLLGAGNRLVTVAMPAAALDVDCARDLVEGVIPP